MRVVLDQAGELQSQTAISLKGLLEASLTVLITTLEDCVWLIPFVAQAPNARIALAHALVFIFTFVGCAVVTSLLAVFLNNLIGSGGRMLLEVTGAMLCWILSGFFFFRSYLKRRRKRRLPRRQHEHELREAEEASTLITQNEENQYESVVATSSHSGNGTDTSLELGEGCPAVEGIEPYGVLDASAQTADIASVAHDQQASNSMQPWIIVSLTILGSLDEVSYFPALIVGQIFTMAELIAATLVASLLILLLVDVLKQRCGNLLRILDQIPLYTVIAAFAVFLTVEVFVDLVAG